MAKPKSGILAILGNGGDSEAEGDEEESDGEPKSAKTRALKAFFEAGKAGDWDEAATQFQAAYDECAMHSEESEEETDEEL